MIDAPRHSDSHVTVAKPLGSDTLNVDVVDPYGMLDDTIRPIVVRMVRLAEHRVPHRLISRFEFVNARLGVAVSLERKQSGLWTAVMPETHLPLTSASTALFAMLLFVGEHGRLPDPTPQPGT
jgi:hypothetical protein